MKIRTLALCAVAVASSACEQAPPDPKASALVAHAMTPDALQLRLSTTEYKRGLKSEAGVEVGRFSAYVTQTFEGIPAPIEYMRAKCPDKVLSAKTTPFYGLEAPYAVRYATVKASGIFDLPIKDVHPAIDATYTGDFVIVDLNGILISLFPKDVEFIDAKGEVLASGAKLLSQVGARASLTPWDEKDKNGRNWGGVRVSAHLHTPVPPPPALNDVLAAQWKEPCQ